jgi:hypothetical protein
MDVIYVARRQNISKRTELPLKAGSRRKQARPGLAEVCGEPEVRARPELQGE